MGARIWKLRHQKNEGTLEENLLAQRGFLDQLEIQKFLDPRYEHCHDPFLLTDMKLAVERIKLAMSKNEKITVYADYDADAVTAAATLLRYFQHLGYQHADHYIPDRFAEGYGMNMDAVKILASRGTNLIITVDCGINAVDSVDAANALGVDVIITDHHQLTGELPQALAVVNPHRPDDTYPCKDLTGVGVAFKLVQALTSSVIASGAVAERGNPSEIASSSIPRNDTGFEKWLLDLVAIGTVADCQSLLYENRILVKWGLVVMQKTRWVGLKKLLEVSGITEGPYDTYQIGFIIAPRINAAGRIDHADVALKLLITDDPIEAEALAEKLNDLNRQRQQQTERILSEAREQVLALGDQKILLAAGEGWHRGIVGLVAGKLTEEFSRPVLVMEKTATEAVGSARSIANFNIVEAIGYSRDILVKYGGHPQAAGFTLKSEHIEMFHKNLLEYAEISLSETDLSPALHYDAEMTREEITDKLLDFLGKLEPFGQGNFRPKFRINNLPVQYVSTVGKDGKHLRLVISALLSPDEGREPPYSAGERLREKGIGCIGFNLGFWAQKLHEGMSVDVICEPQYNEWNGQKNIQLKISDLKLSEQKKPD